MKPDTRNKLPVNSGKLAEDIAKEVVDRYADVYCTWDKWDDQPLDKQGRFIALVRAGMDAKSDITVEIRDDGYTLRGSVFPYISQLPKGTYYLTPKKD